MTVQQLWYQGHMQYLGDRECLRLLNSAQIGRVAYNDDEGPVVLPVNHRMDGSYILFRTSPMTALGRHLSNAPVSFQVDEFDDFNRAGWSVLVRGVAEYVGPEDLPKYASDLPEPWPTGDRAVYVRITPRAITGRRLLAS
jgi:nitroimidazol reductase NimA-like FMN-containing flavoprotein (pyridoxamine 5'-phosphate oxidase superfamily)